MTSHPLFDVAGRSALVTGSSRGIGRALAAGLLGAGCTVVLNGRDREVLEATRAQLSAVAGSTGGVVHAVDFDNTDPAAVADGIRRAEDLAGPLDIAVCNTGTQHRQPVLQVEDADWFRLLDTNLTSTFMVAREVGRRMASRGRGKIVTVCSVQSEVARPGIAPYAATKGALKMLTKGMCADLAPLGIQVNGLGPGYIETELTAALVADPEFTEWVRGRTPAGRWGRVDDLVGTLLYLVSPASDFVNGQIVYVDGGMLAVL
jgi:gluconate 5-dehydrogenase